MFYETWEKDTQDTYASVSPALQISRLMLEYRFLFDLCMNFEDFICIRDDDYVVCRGCLNPVFQNQPFVSGVTISWKNVSTHQVGIGKKLLISNIILVEHIL